MVDQDDIKYMPIREFIDEGYLQEVNRLVLHPAGLAMALYAPGDELVDQTVIKIWDYRDDPEGMLFAPGEISQEKIESVQAEIGKHVEIRRQVLGTDPRNGFGYIQMPNDTLTPPED